MFIYKHLPAYGHTNESFLSLRYSASYHLLFMSEKKSHSRLKSLGIRDLHLYNKNRFFMVKWVGFGTAIRRKRK